MGSSYKYSAVGGRSYASSVLSSSVGGSLGKSRSHGQREDSTTLPWLQRVHTRSRKAFWRFLYDTSDNASVHWTIVGVLWFFGWVNALLVTLPPAENMPWVHSNFLRILYSVWWRVAILVAPPGAAAGEGGARVPHYSDTSLFVATWSLGLIWVVMVVGGSAMHLHDASFKDHRHLAWRSRIFHDYTMVMTQYFGLPVMVNLLSIFACRGQYWQNDTRMPCFEGPHAVWVGLSAALLPIVVIGQIFISSTVVTRHNGVDKRTGLPALAAPSVFQQGAIKDALSASHARADVAMVGVRFMLACLYAFGAEIMPPWAYVVCTGALCIVWFAVYFYLLPYHMMLINQLQCTFAAASFAGVVTLGVAQILKEQNMQIEGSAPVMWLVVVLAGVAAFVAVHLRANSMLHVRGDIASSYMLDLHARCIITYLGASDNLLTAVGRHTAHKPITTDDDSNDDAAVEIRPPMDVGPGSAGDGAVAEGMWAHLDSLYEDASIRLSTSATFHLLYAHYLGRYRGNRHLERLHLRQCAGLVDSLAYDLQYFIWLRFEEMEREDDASGQSHMTVEKRVQYETLLGMSRHQVSRARELVLTWWTILCDRVPDMARLEATGRRITVLSDATVACFEELMSLAPNSTAVLRGYAEFLIDLANDSGRANQLLEAAEQLEDEQSRAHSNAGLEDITALMTLPQTDLSGESLGLLEISLQPGNVGTILSANLAALRLLGYMKRELLGREFSSILPDPLSVLLHDRIQEFVKRGTVNLSDAPRAMFLSHHAGHVVPTRMEARPNDEVLWLALEELQTQQGFVVFTGPRTGWRVTGVCKRSIVTLGVDAQSVTLHRISMQQLIPDIDECVARMDSSNEPELLVLHSVAPTAGGADQSGSASAAGVSVRARLQRLPMRHASGGAFLLRWHAISPIEQQSHASSLPRAATPAHAMTAPATTTRDAAASFDAGSGPKLVRFQATGAEPSSASHAALKVDTRLRSSSLRLDTPHASATVSDPALHSLARTVSIDSPSQPSELRILAPEVSHDAGGAQVMPVTRSGSGPHVLQAGSSRMSNHPLLKSEDSDNDSDAPASGANSAASTRDSMQASARQQSPREDDFGAFKGHHVAVRSQKATNALDQPFSGAAAPTHAMMPPGAGGRAGSVHSGDKSVTSAGSVSQLLRGSLRSSTRFEPSLRLLHRTLILTFVTLGIINIASLGVLVQLFSELSSNITIVRDAADRAIMVTRVVSATQQLFWNTAGLMPMSDGGNFTKRVMVDALDHFHELHLSLYDRVDGRLHEETQLYTEPSIAIVEPTWSLFTNAFVLPSPTTRYVNLMNAGTEFEMRARRVALIPTGRMNLYSPDPWWMIGIMPDMVLPSMNTSIFLADQRSSSQMDIVRVADTTSIGIAIGIFLFMALIVVMPAIVGVLRDKKHVFELYMDVPLPVARVLRNRASKRVAQQRQEEADADGGRGVTDEPPAGAHTTGREDDDGFAGDADAQDDDDRLRAVLQAMRLQQTQESSAVQRSTPAMLAHSASSRRLSVADRGTAAAPAHDPDTTLKRRAYKHGRSDTWKVLALFVVPAAVYMTYYLGMFFYRRGMTDFARNARKEVLWSKQLELNVFMINFNLRYAAGTCTPGFTDVQVNLSNAIGAAVESLQDAILYGNTDLGVRGALQTSPEVANLYLQDGCVGNNDYYYNMSECRSGFYNGIVGHGLLGAFKEYLRLAERTGSDQILALGRGAACTPQILTHGTAGLLHTLAERMLVPGFGRMATVLYTTASDRLAEFIRNNVILMILSLLVLAFYFFGIYAPAIRWMDRDIKQTRRLLLLLPDELATMIPSINKLARKLANTSADELSIRKRT